MRPIEIYTFEVAEHKFGITFDLGDKSAKKMSTIVNEGGGRGGECLSDKQT